MYSLSGFGENAYSNIFSKGNLIEVQKYFKDYPSQPTLKNFFRPYNFFGYLADISIVEIILEACIFVNVFIFPLWVFIPILDTVDTILKLVIIPLVFYAILAWYENW